jgi:hypothetical protein
MAPEHHLKEHCQTKDEICSNTLQRLGILYTVYSAISWEKITLENLAFL